MANQIDAPPQNSETCSGVPTHRVTIQLDHTGAHSSIAIETDMPDVVREAITEALDKCYRFRWRMRKKTYLTIEGTTFLAIPIEKVLFFKIEPISP